ncbi:MAG: hypothetical protein ACOYOU_17870, partial [Kiritimatiellia bacterium]
MNKTQQWRHLRERVRFIRQAWNKRLNRHAESRSLLDLDRRSSGGRRCDKSLQSKQENGQGRRYIFKPAVLPHFHSGDG